jgi:cytochrome c
VVRSAINEGLLALTFAIALSVPSRAQDAAAGQTNFLICSACHEIGPGAQNAIGPVLNGVVGRKAGTYPGYAYSDANKNSDITWTEDELQKYLAAPQKVVPGTKMTFPGFHSDTKKIDNVIAFLKQYKADGTKSQ